MLDVRRSPELQAALLGIKRAEREVRNNINADARKLIKPEWEQALNGFVETRLEQRVIVRGARIKVGVRNIRLEAATSKKALSGGLVPAFDYAPVAYGAARRKKTYAVTSRLGKRYTVTKTVGAQFRPRIKKGYVANPAASHVVTRIVGIWINTIVDNFRSFADVKGR